MGTSHRRYARQWASGRACRLRAAPAVNIPVPGSIGDMGLEILLKQCGWPRSAVEIRGQLPNQIGIRAASSHPRSSSVSRNASEGGHPLTAALASRKQP